MQLQHDMLDTIRAGMLVPSARHCCSCPDMRSGLVTCVRQYARISWRVRSAARPFVPALRRGAGPGRRNQLDRIKWQQGDGDQSVGDHTSHDGTPLPEKQADRPGEKGRVCRHTGRRNSFNSILHDEQQ